MDPPGDATAITPLGELAAVEVMEHVRASLLDGDADPVSVFALLSVMVAEGARPVSDE